MPSPSRGSSEHSDDLICAVMRFDSGTTGLLEVNWITPTKVRELSVLGEGGMFVVNYLTQDLTFYEHPTKSTEWDQLAGMHGGGEGDMIRYALERREPLRLQWEAFIDAVGRGGPAPVDGLDGLATLSTARAIHTPASSTAWWRRATARRALPEPERQPPRAGGLEIAGSSALVTGGAGFIGSHLVERLLAAGASRVHVLDDLSLGAQANIADALAHPEVELTVGDVADAELLERIVSEEGPFDHCYNLAVLPLPHSLERPRENVDRNVAMTTAVCELGRAGGYRRLVQFSSSEVYGTALTAPMDEEHPLHPHTPYAAAKAATDLVALSYATTFELDVVLVRPFNTYGERQNDGAYAGLIPAVVRAVLADEPITIDGDGEQTRDMAYVLDTTQGTLLAAATPDLTGETFQPRLGRGDLGERDRAPAVASARSSRSPSHSRPRSSRRRAPPARRHATCARAVGLRTRDTGRGRAQADGRVVSFAGSGLSAAVAGLKPPRLRDRCSSGRNPRNPYSKERPGHV